MVAGMDCLDQEGLSVKRLSVHRQDRNVSVARRFLAYTVPLSSSSIAVIREAFNASP